MTVRRFLSLVFLLIPGALPLVALPVSIGQVEIGLESFDGYQEGQAFLSINETGTSLEILISYKGFGLDTVTWTFSDTDLFALREASANAAWWRSRLLEMNVGQTVIRDAVVTAPTLIYTHRSSSYPFDSAEHVLRFVRQGRDYALLLTERSRGPDTRRSGDKTVPVFTVHFAGRELPDLRDMISEQNMNTVLTAFTAEKAAIEVILNSGPDSSE